jgi:hypothetical protein
MRRQIAELERQRAALPQEFNAAQEFWAQVESTLKAHRVHAIRDLPKDVQRSLVERLPLAAAKWNSHHGKSSQSFLLRSSNKTRLATHPWAAEC